MNRGAVPTMIRSTLGCSDNQTNSGEPEELKMRCSLAIPGPHNDGSRTLLPEDYTPSPYTVVLGRGKACTNATGSNRLRVIASTFLDEYTEATTKGEKSSIVSNIVEIIESMCPSGKAFVLYAEGRWWEVGNSSAREKVGYILRDLLGDKYRSSSKSKAARRNAKFGTRLRKGKGSRNGICASSPSSSSGEEGALGSGLSSHLAKDTVLVNSQAPTDLGMNKLTDKEQRQSSMEVSKTQDLFLGESPAIPGLYTSKAFKQETNEWLEHTGTALPFREASFSAPESVLLYSFAPGAATMDLSQLNGDATRLGNKTTSFHASMNLLASSLEILGKARDWCTFDDEDLENIFD